MAKSGRGHPVCRASTARESQRTPADDCRRIILSFCLPSPPLLPVYSESRLGSRGSTQIPAVVAPGVVVTAGALAQLAESCTPSGVGAAVSVIAVGFTADGGAVTTPVTPFVVKTIIVVTAIVVVAPATVRLGIAGLLASRAPGRNQ